MVVPKRVANNGSGIDSNRLPTVRSAHRVFQDQRPSDGPGGELAHGGVSICVRAAGDGNHGGELGIAKSREEAAKSAND